MKKRLHDQGLWRKPWFRQLSNDAKLLWLYLCDECDCCGVWERDDEQATFYLRSKKLPFEDLKKNLFTFCHQKKILIVDFCEFQYNLPEKYSETSNLHKNILNRLNYHNLSFKIIEKLKNKSTVAPTVAPTVNISISKSISINKSKNINTEFDEFWNLYPKKVGKKYALNEWLKIKDPIETLSKIKSALFWQTKSFDWTKENGQYIPHPSTYLNQGRWMDEPIKPIEQKRLNFDS